MLYYLFIYAAQFFLYQECNNCLGPIAPNVVIILSASSCDFRQCPWEIGSVTAERAGQGEVGGCTRRVQTAWPCLGSAVERSWSALGGPFPPFLA